jgi:hypothetical protein
MRSARTGGHHTRAAERLARTSSSSAAAPCVRRRLRDDADDAAWRGGGVQRIAPGDMPVQHFGVGKHPLREGLGGTAGGSPSHFRVPAENHAPAGDSFHAASPKRPEARRARASSSPRDFSAQRVQRDRKRSADADRFGASALLMVARDAGLSVARRSATVVPANGGVTLMAGTPRNQREP